MDHGAAESGVGMGTVPGGPDGSFLSGRRSAVRIQRVGRGAVAETALEPRIPRHTAGAALSLEAPSGKGH